MAEKESDKQYEDISPSEKYAERQTSVADAARSKSVALNIVENPLKVSHTPLLRPRRHPY